MNPALMQRKKGFCTSLKMGLVERSLFAYNSLSRVSVFHGSRPWPPVPIFNAPGPQVVFTGPD